MSSRPYNLQSLPSELCHQIFTLACTDGGPTALALARVSRSVHHAAAPVRFQRTCIRGLAQLRALAAALDAHPSADVQHLLFADHTADRAPPFERRPTPVPTTRGSDGRL